jgi:hypothetical protein
MYWDVLKYLEDVLRCQCIEGCIRCKYIQYILQYIGCIENWQDVLKCIEGCIGCIAFTAECIERCTDCAVMPGCISDALKNCRMYCRLYCRSSKGCIRCIEI